MVSAVAETDASLLMRFRLSDPIIDYMLDSREMHLILHDDVLRYLYSAIRLDLEAFPALMATLLDCAEQLKAFSVRPDDDDAGGRSDPTFVRSGFSADGWDGYVDSDPDGSFLRCGVVGPHDGVTRLALERSSAGMDVVLHDPRWRLAPGDAYDVVVDVGLRTFGDGQAVVRGRNSVVFAPDDRMRLPDHFGELHPDVYVDAYHQQWYFRWRRSGRAVDALRVLEQCYTDNSESAVP